MAPIHRALHHHSKQGPLRAEQICHVSLHSKRTSHNVLLLMCETCRGHHLYNCYYRKQERGVISSMG